ncbi:MAG: ABC transporter ATP-binding protein [Endomicrobiales bacterium]|jgi:ABC-2 type transport system ATP-binding protein
MEKSNNVITIDIKNLVVKFGDFVAVDNVSFSVSGGEIFGFLGANGAGKTTTIRVMCGLLSPTSGDVCVAGLDFEKGGDAIKKKVGYMSQKFTLYDDLTVEENMAFKAAIRRIPKDTARSKGKELFDFIAFNYPVTTLVKNLPTGIKQQISLAASLLHDPDIIFLDEPTSGVSPLLRAKFWELIRQLAEKGKTVIVTTHYMDEAEQCERIALMRTGKIIALDSPQNLKKEAYPEPIMEVVAHEKSRADMARHLSEDKDVASFWTYGLKYHAALKQKAGMDPFVQHLPAGATAKVITPSLEDVFLCLVEGADR